MVAPKLVPVSGEDLTAFCQRWKVRELALFGSVLRRDFTSGSDIDVLVTFGRDARWSLLDTAHMEEELSRLVGRPVDLVNRGAIERSDNWIRRQAILGSAEPIYVAG